MQAGSPVLRSSCAKFAGRKALGRLALLLAALVTPLLPGPADAEEPRPTPSDRPASADHAAAGATGTGTASPAVPQTAAPAGSPAAAASPAIQAGDQLPGEVKPDITYFPDKYGKLQPVIGWRIEDFEEIYKFKKGLEHQEQRPQFNIDRIDISGVAQADRAELTVTLTVALRDPQWVRVPLRLGGAVLREPAHYQGEGKHLLHFEDDREGYVCWLRGDPDQTHQLTLRLLAPLAHVGGETRLKLSIPRAALAHLRLTVPVEHAVARVTDVGELQEPGTNTRGKTDLNVLGVGGEFTLAWHAPAAAPPVVPTVLEATGALLVRIDGRSVNTDARLTVRSFGGQFDTFRVRLPPEAEIVGTPQPGVTLTPLPPESTKKPEGAGKKAPPAGKLVEVKLDRKTAGPVELRLITERPYNIAEAGESLELAGFEVGGAVRQWGHIAVEVVGNWQVVWGPRNSIRQIDDLPEGLRRDDLAAGFEYSVQPCSLTARVVPQKTRISVDPEYVLLVGAQRVQLRAKLKYKVRGAKVRALDMELPGWIVDDVGPANFVSADAPLTADEANLSLPLVQPTSGDFELTLEAHREIASDADQLRLELPRPVAEATSQAAVVVVPADNVEINPIGEELVGLVPQSLKPQMKLPERQQDPLLFRCETNPAQFVAAFRVHAKSVTVEAVGQADLGEQEILVDERLIYQIAYEPVDKFLLHMPRSITIDKLQATMDGNRLSATVLADEAEAEGAPTVVRVALPAPRIGRCELRVSYALPQERLLPATSVPLSLPLVVPAPADARLTYNQLVISSRPGLTVTLRKGVWSVDSQPRYPALQPGEIVLTNRPTAGDTPLAAPLAVTLKERQSEGSTIVERAWIQTTWLGEALRQERAVYRFTTSAPLLRVSLPEGVVLTDLKVRLDAKGVAPEVDRENLLTVRLPQTLLAHEHLLQLDYRFAPREHGTHMRLSAAQFKGVWVRRCYWQLILPPQEHLLFSAGDCTREFSWTWDRFGYRRQPTLEQPELESWIGVTPGDLPPAADNRYLFSSLGPQADLQVWTIRRSVLVFGASLVLLLAGLLLIYVPAVRHPGVLFVAAVGLLSGAIIEPEATLLLAQGAGLGLSLAALAAVLARRVRRRLTPPTAVVIRSPSSILDRSLTQSMPRVGKNGPPASTATARMSIQVAAPESKS